MDNFWIVIGPLIGGYILYQIINATVRVPGGSLQQRFVSLGVLRGKTRSEIEAKVGPANGVSATADGKTICQWMATGYHIVLVFDGDVCEGVSHEFKA